MASQVLNLYEQQPCSALNNVMHSNSPPSQLEGSLRTLLDSSCPESRAMKAGASIGICGRDSRIHRLLSPLLSFVAGALLCVQTPEPLPPPPPPQGMMRPPPPPPSIPPAPHPPASIAPDAAGGGGHAVPPAQVYPYPSPSQLQPMQQPIKPVPPSPPQPSTISSRGGVGGVVEQQGSEQDGGADSPAMMRDQVRSVEQKEGVVGVMRGEV